MEQSTRLIWIDHVKLFACILVVLGHLFPSLIAPGVLPQWGFFTWFHDFVYTFHVQLFFICSGYLYQKFTKYSSVRDYAVGIGNKFLALGVPYFTFSFITWAMKKAFSDAVNNDIGGLFETLFLSPTAPYWYLYILFFLFVFILPAQNNKILITELILTALLKLLSLLSWLPEIYILTNLSAHAIWFVLGMLLAKGDVLKKITGYKASGILATFAGVLALAISLLCFFQNLNSPFLNFFMGISACTATLLFAVIFSSNEEKAIFLSKYTMPIYLLHTIFAAGIRIVLLKVGVQNGVLHLLVGLAFSIAVPTLVGLLAQKLKFADFFFYPTKYLKIRRTRK